MSKELSYCLVSNKPIYRNNDLKLLLWQKIRYDKEKISLSLELFIAYFDLILQ